MECWRHQWAAVIASFLHHLNSLEMHGVGGGGGMMLSSIVHLNLMMTTIHHTTPDLLYVSSLLSLCVAWTAWWIDRGNLSELCNMGDDERNVILVLMVSFHTHSSLHTAVADLSMSFLREINGTHRRPEEASWSVAAQRPWTARYLMDVMWATERGVGGRDDSILSPKDRPWFYSGTRVLARTSSWFWSVPTPLPLMSFSATSHLTRPLSAGPHHGWSIVKSGTYLSDYLLWIE